MGKTSDAWIPQVGQYVIYIKFDRAEIGLVEEVVDKTAVRVYYHSGDTAALTKVSDLLPLSNACYISSVLGGKEKLEHENA